MPAKKFDPQAPHDRPERRHYEIARDVIRGRDRLGNLDPKVRVPVIRVIEARTDKQIEDRARGRN